ncbi:pyridoxamine 5'-phosphate oxidase family protein [Amycolatopsis sp. WGS_07]|uniref:pyridoxamine 5'-phosphate oxidase family protein n=1 Tax=Amycolatopsis sp. WGS_07 TaxID=3076764 RepID=UPI003872ACE7
MTTRRRFASNPAARAAQPAAAGPHASAGELHLQQESGTAAKAQRFYDTQMISYLNDAMQQFVRSMEMFFLATSDTHGYLDCSVRTGKAGFVQISDEKTLCYPEYRGNGVKASMGNIRETAALSLLFIDFENDSIGLHVNGRGKVLDSAQLPADLAMSARTDLELSNLGSRHPEHWVMVTVEAAYVHCSKHLPRMIKVPRETHRGSDQSRHKGGDYFGVAAESIRTGV